MRELRDTVYIETPPERVWNWMMGLVEHYPDWHPDHLSAVWERGEPNRVGSVINVVERLGGHVEDLHLLITDINAPERMAYQILGAHGVLLPGGSFTIVPDDGGCRFTATVSYRFGEITKRLFARRVSALHQHMHEEGENLKQLVETNQATPG